MEKLSLLKIACAVFAFCLAVAIVLPAQTFTSLAKFDVVNGLHPDAGVVQGTDGNFYGTTEEGGANAGGTVFKITPDGTLTTLYNFCAQTGCPDGQAPDWLVLSTDGNFYGTAGYGGGSTPCSSYVPAGCGTVFTITPGGALTTLHSFNGTDGSGPVTLVQGSDGNFYGTTIRGGAIGYGTIFKITPGGQLTTLHNFYNKQASGAAGALLEVADGSFYGTTDDGGDNCKGIVFRFNPAAGKLTTLHSFNGTDGSAPGAGLVRGADGNFYGTTYNGGADNTCTSGCGTVFRITPKGTLTTLHSFDNTDGSNPEGWLVQGTDGNFYGTTTSGGQYCNPITAFCGTVFRITPKGTLTTLYSFGKFFGADFANGAEPLAGLVQGSDGNFYGTTVLGGNDCEGSGCGTVFTLSVELGPFVVAQTTIGKVGAAVIILGTNLTGATAVSFNGAAATFTVVSSSEITTTVPVGATTGKILVTTPSGTLKSNTAFNVTPQILRFTPPSGLVGTPVQITGISLTQTARVDFDGVTATTFKVNSDSQVIATVPAGANTGRIAISTPGGLARSWASFTVTK